MDFVKSIGSTVVQKFDSLQGSDLEKKVKDATSNENWGSSGTTKNEIAEATYDNQCFREIMAILWKRIGEKDTNWRIVFKSLELLMFLLKCGSDRVVDEVRDHQFTLKRLQNFTYSDPANGQDRGRGIRQLSQQILELVGDIKKLREVREESQKQRRKLQDINKSNITSENYGGFGYNSSNYKSRSSDDYASRNRDDEDEENSQKKRKKEKAKVKRKMNLVTIQMIGARRRTPKRKRKRRRLKKKRRTMKSMKRHQIKTMRLKMTVLKRRKKV